MMTKGACFVRAGGDHAMAAAIAGGFVNVDLKRENERLHAQLERMNRIHTTEAELIRAYRAERMQSYRRPARRKRSVLRTIGLWAIGVALELGLIEEVQRDDQ